MVLLCCSGQSQPDEASAQNGSLSPQWHIILYPAGSAELLYAVLSHTRKVGTLSVSARQWGVTMSPMMAIL